jgi:hypothetical protein
LNASNILRLYPDNCCNNICCGIVLYSENIQAIEELDQIRVTETIFNDLRQLDRELSALPASSQDNQGSKEDLYSRILNTVDWLSFLISTKVITDRRMIAYMKPTLTQYYQDVFVQKMLADERYSRSYHHFKNLYQRMKQD